MGFELDNEDRHEQESVEAKSARISAVMRIASQMQQSGVDLHQGDKDPKSIETKTRILLNSTLDSTLDHS